MKIGFSFWSPIPNQTTLILIPHPFNVCVCVCTICVIPFYLFPSYKAGWLVCWGWSGEYFSHQQIGVRFLWLFHPPVGPCLILTCLFASAINMIRSRELKYNNNNQLTLILIFLIFSYHLVFIFCFFIIFII